MGLQQHVMGLQQPVMGLQQSVMQHVMGFTAACHGGTAAYHEVTAAGHGVPAAWHGITMLHQSCSSVWFICLSTNAVPACVAVSNQTFPALLTAEACFMSAKGPTKMSS